MYGLSGRVSTRPRMLSGIGSNPTQDNSLSLKIAALGFALLFVFLKCLSLHVVHMWTDSSLPPGPAQGGVCVGGGCSGRGGLHLPAGQGPAEEEELAV